MSLTKVTRTVVDSISSFLGINNTTGAITSVVPDLMPSNSTLYPSFACRAWVNFNGVQSGTLTYTISGNLVTITQSSHGMTTGMIANLTFSSGTVSGTANYVITYLTDNTYNVTVAVSGSTGGNVVRNTFIRGSGNVSSVLRNGTGDYTITFTTAMPDANYSISTSITNTDSATNASFWYVINIPATSVGGIFSNSQIKILTGFGRNDSSFTEFDPLYIGINIFR